MRVLLNRTTALGARTGIGHYTSQLLRHLRKLAPADRFDAFPPRWWGWLSTSARGLRSRTMPQGTAHSATAATAPRRARLAGYLRYLERAALSMMFRADTYLRPYDLYHEPNFMPLPSALPTVVTLHDLSVLLHPEWHPGDRVAHFERHFHRSTKDVRQFLAVSDCIRLEIVRKLGIAPERITRTYLGVRENLRPLWPESTTLHLRQLGLDPGYLLFVGTLEPRKNTLLLMQAYCDLPSELRERCRLVLAGGWGWNTAPIADYYESKGRQYGVLQLGYVDEQHLAALYNGARALVFPTLYEGFGMPPIEMMACGGAVLASTADAVAETVGSRAHLIDPHDTTAWRNAMKRAIEDEEWLRSLRTGTVELARRYTWQTCARETLEVYRRAAAGETIPTRAAA